MTVYFETVPSDFLERALYLEAERLGVPPLGARPGEVRHRARGRQERAPAVVRERPLRARRGDDPGQRLPQGASVFVVGDRLDGGPDGATLDDLKRFFAEFYHPANATLCLAGDFDPAEAQGADRASTSARSPPARSPQAGRGPRRPRRRATRSCRPTSVSCPGSTGPGRPSPTTTPTPPRSTCSPRPGRRRGLAAAQGPGPGGAGRQGRRGRQRHQGDRRPLHDRAPPAAEGKTLADDRGGPRRRSSTDSRPSPPTAASWPGPWPSSRQSTYHAPDLAAGPGDHAGDRASPRRTTRPITARTSPATSRSRRPTCSGSPGSTSRPRRSSSGSCRSKPGEPKSEAVQAGPDAGGRSRGRGVRRPRAGRPGPDWSKLPGPSTPAAVPARRVRPQDALERPRRLGRPLEDPADRQAG